MDFCYERELIVFDAQVEDGIRDIFCIIWCDLEKSLVELYEQLGAGNRGVSVGEVEGRQ
jgi:hypothetical protein